MILAADMEDRVAQIVFLGSFCAFMVPMLIVRGKGELSLSEFMGIGFIWLGSFMLLALVRAAIYGYLGKPL